MAAHNNLIKGEWVAGASDTPNVKPSNVKDIVGEYAQADAAARGRCPTSSRAAVFLPACSTSSWDETPWLVMVSSTTSW